MIVNAEEPPTAIGRGFFMLRVDDLLTVAQIVFRVFRIVPGETVSLLWDSNP